MIDNIVFKTYLTIILTGIECGLIGVFIFLLNIPFIGVAISHSAMAGGIWGILLGLPSKLSAFVLSLIASFLIGPIADKSKINPNISLSIIFSLVMGLAFLGVGLISDNKTHIMSFLWGNIFLVGKMDLFLMTLLLIVLICVISLFFKEFLAILFNREIAASVGINDKLFYYILLFFIGAIITVNLNTIGGLMLFSLIITPPAIAYQLTFDLKTFFILSALFGIAGGCGGVSFSLLFNLPVSASVVIFTSLLFIIVMFFSKKNKAYASG